MSGGFNSYSYSDNLPKRLGLIKKVVSKSDADFVGLIDTFRWRQIFTEKELQEHFGYKNVFCIDMDDDRVEKEIGLTVLTNLDTKFEKIRIHNRNCIKSTIKNAGRGYTLWTVYLDDLNEDTRLEETKSLLDKVSPKHTILMGDFNSFSREDLKYFSQTMNQVKNNIPKELESLKKVLRGMQRCEIVTLLEKRGFINGIPEFKPTIPTKLFPGNFEKPFIRVDYVFHTNDIKLKKTGVLDSPLLQKTSDHLPIWFEV